MARAAAPRSGSARNKAPRRGAGRPSEPAGSDVTTPCAVCLSPLRRRIEMRLFQGAAAAEALADLDRCGLSSADISNHFESGHLCADPEMLIASLIDLAAAAAGDARSAGGKEPSLAAVNQSHKLRLEAIKLIADIAGGSRGGGSQEFRRQTINMLLSDEQANDMRKVAAQRRRRSGR